jgi:hypothetical protein
MSDEARIREDAERAWLLERAARDEINGLRSQVATLQAERDALKRGDSPCVDDDGTPFASARTWCSGVAFPSVVSAATFARNIARPSASTGPATGSD